MTESDDEQASSGPLSTHDKWLRDRLDAAIRHYANGNVEALARMLGYKNGGFIRMCLTGKRRVRRSLILKFRRLPAGADWFGQEAGMQAGAPSAHEESPPTLVGMRRAKPGSTLNSLAAMAKSLPDRERKRIADLASMLIMDGPSTALGDAIDQLAMNQIVTTNYDAFMESAFRSTARGIAANYPIAELRPELAKFLAWVDKAMADEHLAATTPSQPNEKAVADT